MGHSVIMVLKYFIKRFQFSNALLGVGKHPELAKLNVSRSCNFLNAPLRGLIKNKYTNTNTNTYTLYTHTHY